jgi:hypothetical protein
VFVVLIIIKITAVLLHAGINTEFRWVHSLHSEIVCAQFAIELTVFLAIGSLGPERLNVRSPDDMIPVRIRTTGVFLRGREETEFLHGLGELPRYLFPELLGVAAKVLDALAEQMEWFAENIVVIFKRQAERMLQLGDGSYGGPHEERRRERGLHGCGVVFWVAGTRR